MASDFTFTGILDHTGKPIRASAVADAYMGMDFGDPSGDVSTIGIFSNALPVKVDLTMDTVMQTFDQLFGKPPESQVATVKDLETQIRQQMNEALSNVLTSNVRNAEASRQLVAATATGVMVGKRRQRRRVMDDPARRRRIAALSSAGIQLDPADQVFADQVTQHKVRTLRNKVRYARMMVRRQPRWNASVCEFWLQSSHWFSDARERQS